MNISKTLIDILNKSILGKIKPDLTILNTVNKKNLIKRLKLRKKNRYDLFDIKFYQRVQRGFIKISKDKKKYYIVDSNKSISDNKIKIFKKISQIL